MALFLWKKSYEIGAAEIDAQHRLLVKIINELSDAMMIRQGHRSVPHILEQLEDYIQLHFTTEENLMLKMNYPALNEHRQEHLDMTKKVLKFKARYSRDHDLFAGELLDFLSDWLRKHIVSADKEFGKHIKRVEMGLL